MNVQKIIEAMEHIAPPALALEGDYIGLLVGAPQDEVRSLLLWIDVTHAAIDRAMQCGANVIVAHHKLMHKGIYTLRADDYEGGLLTRLIRENIALYASHTNLDVGWGGVEDSLAQALGLKVDVREQFVRVGTVEKTTAIQFAQLVRREMSPQAMFYGQETAQVTRVCTSCGSGGGDYVHALAHGAQVFITGEMRHDQCIQAQGRGLCVILTGHAQSEQPALPPLQKKLLVKTGLPVEVYSCT